MTIGQAIEKIDTLFPNDYTTEEKISWLSQADGYIKEEIIDTHEDGESIVFNGYDKNTPLTTELIAKAPHDDLYLTFMEAKIDYYNHEFTKYNNSMTAFEDDYSTYRNFYNRQHMPKQTRIRYF